MAVTYFGNNTLGDGTAGYGGYANYNVDTSIPYICPGTGKQNIAELACYTDNIGGNVRVAIYDTSLNFIAQGETELAAVENGWVTHTTFVDAAGEPISPQLDGGTHYLLAVTGDGTVVLHKTAVTSGYHKYISSDYTGGFPATIGAGSNSSAQPCVRCGVEPAAGGASVVPQAMAYYQRLRQR